MSVSSVYEQRILNNQALINELQATRSKLEAKFEQQKQVATETYKVELIVNVVICRIGIRDCCEGEGTC